jgi:hypothetical protein
MRAALSNVRNAQTDDHGDDQPCVQNHPPAERNQEANRIANDEAYSVRTACIIG